MHTKFSESLSEVAADLLLQKFQKLNFDILNFLRFGFSEF